MTDTTLSIVHPWDPWAQGIGGFDTCIDGILRTAPASWRIELIGVSSDRHQRPVGRWLSMSMNGRGLRFFAALDDPEPDAVRRIPLSVRFALACRGRKVRASGRIVQYHRFESSYAVPARPSQQQVFFIHNHPEEVGTLHSDVRWKSIYGVFLRLLHDRLIRASAVVCVDPRTPAWVRAQMPSLDGSVVMQRQWADPVLFASGAWERRQEDRRSLRTQLGWEPEAKVVMFAGRFERQKDPLFLLDAFAELASRRRDAALLLVGKGRLQSRVEERADTLRLGPRFRMLSPVPRQELARVYRGSDVAACTSVFEAGPRHVFEALACGVPVVSCDVGQVPGLIPVKRRLGRLVSQRDPSAFAHSLHQVLERGLTEEVAQGCAAAVAESTPLKALTPIYDRYRTWLDTKYPSTTESGRKVGGVRARV